MSHAVNDDTTRATTLLLLQLADSGFPTGGFAHSSGLEAAWQLGEVNADSLPAHLDALLEQAGHAALPFTTSAFDDPSTLPDLDRHCDAFTSNHVANRASRTLGLSLLATASASFPDRGLGEVKTLVRRTRLPGHLAPMHGVVCSHLGLARRDAQRLFLFGALRSAVSASVRLSIIGPLEAQRVQAGLASRVEAILDACTDLVAEQATATTPLLDLFQGHQDRLYSRLFSS